MSPPTTRSPFGAGSRHETVCPYAGAPPTSFHVAPFQRRTAVCAPEVAEAIPQGNQLPDGTRQISASGPYYRGPGAAAAGPAHHYVFEIYALDSTIDVAAVGQSPPLTRAAVEQAMANKIRAKGTLIGLFKR
jgi:phosphatidylethanolamine-binding protein (PEBP) family uncharacterized protein